MPQWSIAKPNKAPITLFPAMGMGRLRLCEQGKFPLQGRAPYNLKNAILRIAWKCHSFFPDKVCSDIGQKVVIFRWIYGDQFVDSLSYLRLSPLSF